MQRIVLFWLVYVLYLCPSWEAHAQAVEIDYASFRADTAYIGSLQRTARSLRHKSTDSGILLYQRALHLSRSMEYIDGMARSLTGLGLFYMDKGDYQKSTTYYQLAEPVCSMSTFKNGFLLANLYNSIAALYGNRGVSDSAIHYYYKALNHIQQPRGQAGSYQPGRARKILSRKRNFDFPSNPQPAYAGQVLQGPRHIVWHSETARSVAKLLFQST
jgi:tetratricopeptide (TPR) repeat protein